MRDASKLGKDSTTSDVLEGIDLNGKLALITGASGGLGAETARALAEKGARVILTARDLPTPTLSRWERENEGSLSSQC
jgi:short-subunit dehydrogenase involved in D-alanine esterification of teichoic acids